jgi:hypothetical protein
MKNAFSFFVLVYLVFNQWSIVAYSQSKFDEQKLEDPKSNGEEIANLFATIEVNEYQKKEQNCIYLKNGFRVSTFINEKEWTDIQDTVEAYRIDIVYSKYPIRKGTYYEIYPLLFNRLKSLFAMDGSLNRADIEWNKVLQTNCINDNQVNTLFHGVVIWYRPINQVATVQATTTTISKQDKIKQEKTQIADEQATFEEIQASVEHIRGLTEFPDSINQLLQNLPLDKQIEIMKDFLEKEIKNAPDYDLSTATHEQKTSFQQEINEFIARYPVSDSVVYKVFKRHPEWKNMIVINDWTGSMYNYGLQLLDWHMKNFEQSGVISLTLFNDGDGKQHQEKRIGQTGGIYFEEADNIPQLIDLFKLVMLNGSGGDTPENNIEGILAAMEEYENYSEIVLIADNNACVRDIELADRIGKPVRIILCGYTKAKGVNPHYAYLAKMTGGGVYTIENDFEEINIELGEKGEIKTNKEKRFKMTKNACKNFDFIDASQTIHPLDYALKNKKEVRKVNASNLSLEKLPNGLYRIAKLNYLDLSNNNLSELNAKIERFQYLKTLNLSHNQLKDLPQEFGYIRYIENLDLSHNLFDSIPEVLKYSKHLQTLNLSNNAISEVNLSTQVKLNKLDLSYNALSSLPKSFTKLKLITDLNLSNNLFTVFPPQLGNLRKMLRLDLSNNQLTKLPADFYKYQRIKHLNLAGNNFSEEEKARIRKGLPFAQIEF